MSFHPRLRWRPNRQESVTRDGVPGGRRIRRTVGTVLAGLLVLAALVVPNDRSHLVPAVFLRIPVEGLVGAAVLLALPGRARRVAAVVAGVVVGLLGIVKVLDLGFWSVLNRQFDLVADWGLLDDGVSVLADSIGRAGALATAAVVVLVAITAVVLLGLSVGRLSRAAVDHRRTARRTVAVLTVAWVACAAFGVQVVPGAPVAARTDAALVHDRTLLVRAGLHDRRTFAAQAATDRFRGTPGSDLLTALRGKDVIFSFVESYGRSALEDPQLAAHVDPVLDAGNRQLTAAGYASRSAYLTSSTFGGYSWLAHATLQSGLWIDGQQRYRSLVGTDRLTLTGAFRRAGWRTVAVEPGNTYAWPEAEFYGYEQVYDARNLGYRGPAFSWSTMPDQYALAAFERAEHGRPHRPLMAEITLTSSHSPWAPLPRLLDWEEVGDGSGYAPMAAQGHQPEAVWRDTERVRTEFARAVAYSVSTLISYVATYGDDNLVLVFLGDHQPTPNVTGQGASHDVPVTIVARDPAVLDRIAPWGWSAGLRPAPQAPVWRMDSFRDRFLTAFGPVPGQPAGGQPTGAIRPAPGGPG